MRVGKRGVVEGRGYIDKQSNRRGREGGKQGGGGGDSPWRMQVTTE